jgi:hypothetical protein
MEATFGLLGYVGKFKNLLYKKWICNVDPSLISSCGRGSIFMVDISDISRDNIKLDNFLLLRDQ